MASMRAAVPIETRRRAALRLAERWLAGGQPHALRWRWTGCWPRVAAQRDPAAVVTAAHVLQALVLTVLDEPGQ